MGLFDVEGNIDTNDIGDNGNIPSLKIQKKNDKRVKEPKVKVVEDNIEQKKNIREIKEIASFSTFSANILQHFNQKTLHHATMMSGNYGIGKATCAYWLICQMILSQFQDESLQQANFQLLKENNHPDVFFIETKNGENEIKIDDIRLLLDKLLLKSTYGSKFVLIDDINSINNNGINCLLKTLEEPIGETYFFIINHNTTKLLDTVYSRCNQVKLVISKKDCLQALSNIHNELSYDEIEFYSDVAENSICISNILIHLNFFQYKNTDDNTIKSMLNSFILLLEKEYQDMPRVLKLLIIEKVLLYFLKKKPDDMYNRVLLSNHMIKQLLDMKRFELPILFV